MKFVYSLVILSCVLWEARGYPYYPSYGNVDTYAFGDADRGGMAFSRFYNPYYDPSVVRGRIPQPEEAAVHEQSSQYHLPDRRRQALEEAGFNTPPQQNEEAFPQQPEPLYPQQPEGIFPKQPDNQAFVPTEATELVEPTEKVAEAAPTTVKAVAVPESVEPEIESVPEEEPVPKPKQTVSRKKLVKTPVDDDDEEDDYAPKMPTGAYFPMFFGWGGRSGGGPGNGPTAIANSFSTGRKSVSTSHAVAYAGIPRPQERV